MTKREPIDWTRVVIGAVVAAGGVYMTAEGVAHTISGELIPATTWEESNGPETLIIGLVIAGFGVFLAWRSLIGKPWP